MGAGKVKLRDPKGESMFLKIISKINYDSQHIVCLRLSYLLGPSLPFCTFHHFLVACMVNRYNLLVDHKLLEGDGCIVPSTDNQNGSWLKQGPYTVLEGGEWWKLEYLIKNYNIIKPT